ncbi:hypothetical protein HDV04_000381 [Boothiomyces sp. JEL0838]|nr:hypothetical protein HDV04_000381 [Boothiomyces sp. JEL0838]
MDCCISPKPDKKRLSFNPTMQMSPSASAQNKPFLIAIAGGPAAGKKQISEALAQTLPISIVHLESFYKELNDTQMELVKQNEYNFDHPEALDYPLLLSTLESISNGNATSIPIYDFKTKKRIGHDLIQPSVCIVSGALILYYKQIRDLFDLKIFVDLDSDSRVSKLIERSTVSVDQMINKYVKFIKPSFEEFVLPSKKYADVVIPRGKLFLIVGEENEVALDLIKEHINDILNKNEMQSEIEQELNSLNLSLTNDKYQIINREWINDCTDDLTNQILHTDLSIIIQQSEITNQQLFDIIDIKEIGVSIQNQVESFADPKYQPVKKQLLLTVSNGIVQLKALELNDIGLTVLSRGKIHVQGYFKRMFIIESGRYLGDWSITVQEYLDVLTNNETNFRNRNNQDNVGHVPEKPSDDEYFNDYELNDYSFDNIDVGYNQESDMVGFTDFPIGECNNMDKDSADEIEVDLTTGVDDFKSNTSKEYTTVKPICIKTEPLDVKLSAKEIEMDYDDYDIQDDILFDLLDEKENQITITTTIEKYEKISLKNGQLKSLVFVNGEKMQMPDAYIEKYLGVDFETTVKNQKNRAVGLMHNYYDSLKREMTFTIDKSHDMPLIISIDE